MAQKQQKDVNVNVEGSDEEDDKNEGGAEGTKKLSKGQKKKLRQQKKKNEQSKAPTAANEEVKVEAKQGQKEPPKQEKQEKPAKKQEKPKKATKGNAASILAKKKLEQQQKFEEQQERKKKQFQAEQERLRKQEEEKIRKEKEEKEKMLELAKQHIKAEIKKGIYVKKSQREKLERQRQQLLNQKTAEQTKEAKSNEVAEDDQEITQEQIQEQMQKMIKEKKNEAPVDDKQYFKQQAGQYRSPVCCILGHVDTGKTTLLDKIRKTNVQEGEAGGITQQIGATFFPHDKLVSEVKKCASYFEVDVNVPGLLIIDTPGHESFSNLRSRGSSLCDIAILVIDLQHGLQNQTLQSLELLSKRKTPFVVALNKIDRSYSWVADTDQSSYLSLKKQNSDAFNDYQTKRQKIILELNSKGYNVAMYWQNPDPTEYISLVPTSGITGEGLPDLLSVIVKYSLTMDAIKKRIKIKKNIFNCTVMEVKMLEGHGTTIDCILIDGVIKVDDQIVLLGFNGPIVTKVKALLTPHAMKQMRVKDNYLQHQQIFAANGLKISALGLDDAVAGTPLIVANTQDEVQDAKAICQNQFQSIKKKIKLENIGVGVAASTLGSLEALLQYLATEKIPVSYVTVGPVSKDDVMKSMKSMLSQIPERRKKQYACLLVFDVKVLADAAKYAQENEIRIFNANIIYHLTGFFNKYVEEVRQERKQKQGKDAVFPCHLKQVATFRKSDPIVLGVDVLRGVLKIGTPLVVFKKNERGDKQIKLGVVESIEHEHKKIKEARKNTGSVAISIGGDPSIQSGRHFDPQDELVSLVTRRSIDCLKEHYRKEPTADDWQLIAELKKYFHVV